MSIERARMSANNPDDHTKSPEKNDRQKWDEALQHLRAVVKPDDIALMAGVKRGKFNIYYDEKLSPGRLGYTNLQSGGIFINPRELEKMLSEKSEAAVRGFFWHEGGHHAPWVEKLQAKQRAEMVNENGVDAEFKRDPKMAQKYLRALHGFYNAGADIWLEAFMGQPPFQSIKKDIASVYAGMKRESLKSLSKPEQFIQLMVGEARYGSDKPIADMVDDDVFAAYERLCKAPKGHLSAMDVMQRTTEFEQVFATESMREMAIQRKVDVEKKFLAEWIALIRKEAEKRAHEKQQDEKGEGGESGNGGEDKPGESAEQKEQRRQQVQNATEDLLSELADGAKKYEPMLGSGSGEGEEVPESVRKALEQIDKFKPSASPEERATKEAARAAQAGEKKSTDADPGDALERTRAALQESGEISRRRGLAEKYGVDESIIRRWDEIRLQYAETIRTLADQFAEIFIDNRRLRMQFSRREGELTPGLEYPYLASAASGEPDPAVFQQQIRDPELLEIELEFLVDTSGSMSGDKIKYAGDLTVVTIEAFKRVRELLAGEQLLADETEQPLKVGMTTFETSPTRITNLDDPPSDLKEVKMLNALQPGGGTAASGAIAEVFTGLKNRETRVMKIIAIVTDGTDNAAEIKPVMESIIDNKSVVTLVLGIGPEAKDVQSTYIDPLAQIPGSDEVVFGRSAANPNEMIPLVTEFLKDRVPRYYEEHLLNR